ncbi:hypothetical protein [Candidatus Sulfurimonas baltica]|uniref:DUF3828 domain-containing protein n=1 Tax=Candidatus Sulfurimonas baltica TaxID=2740404 RepID=A0A7S7RM77_9BACT|nr:hypothetical protein [Candidatus Sulfurimonas baltica]QOY51867.1 hypothetical protein HUE88_12325 [Candidatus Sulfurimonas baltica]
MIKYFIFYIFLSFTLLASEVDNKPFRELVVGYNHGVLLAAKKKKFDHLQEYLTQAIYYKTLIWLESYQDNYLFMDALLLGIKFGEFNQDGITATLDTHEKWKYRYIDIYRKKVSSGPVKTDYDLRYFFIQLEDGTWKINHIKILKEVNTPIEDN